MTSLVSCPNNNAPRICAVASGASNIITNTTTETVFDQIYTLPSQSQRSVQPISVIRMKAYGIMSTGLLNLNTTVRIRAGGLSGPVVCSTGTFGLTVSLSDDGWEMNAICVVTASGASGQMVCGASGFFAAGLVAVASKMMNSPTTVALDTTVPNDLVFTWQWGTATSNNKAQMTSQIVEIDGP